MRDVIGWIVFGLVVGVIAKLLMPGRDPGGCVITVALGILGAVVGGILAQVLGIVDPSNEVGDRSFLLQLVFAVIGAVIILTVYRLIAKQRA